MQTDHDKEVLRLAELIVEAAPINTVLALKPEMYNFRYQQMRADGKNLNHLLSNGHIAVLRNVLRQCPQCNYALVDQFTTSNDIRASLQQEFPDVNIVQQHRAEADIAVAAASVLARAKFLEVMQELAEQVGRNELPKGGSDAATDCARELMKELGRGALERLVKSILQIIKNLEPFRRLKYMKKLIVNADDFGLHPAINAGIIKGCRDGFITSTSLMCSGAAFEDAVLQAKATPALGVGIHLTLVGGGKPLLQARQLRTLVMKTGFCLLIIQLLAKRWYAGIIKKAEVVSELQAQLERGLSCGLEITHVDSHQHLHVLPGIADIVLDLCSAFGIKKIRMPQEGWFWRGGFDSTAGRLIGREGLSFCSALAKMKARQARFVYPQHFFGMLAGGNLNEFLVGEIIRNLPDGVSEIMTHPGMDAESLEKIFFLAVSLGR